MVKMYYAHNSLNVRGGDVVVIAADLSRVGASHAKLYHNSVSHDTTWLLSQSVIG